MSRQHWILSYQLYRDFLELTTILIWHDNNVSKNEKPLKIYFLSIFFFSPMLLGVINDVYGERFYRGFILDENKVSKPVQLNSLWVATAYPYNRRPVQRHINMRLSDISEDNRNKVFFIHSLSSHRHLHFPWS